MPKPRRDQAFAFPIGAHILGEEVQGPPQGLYQDPTQGGRVAVNVASVRSRRYPISVADLPQCRGIKVLVKDLGRGIRTGGGEGLWGYPAILGGQIDRVCIGLDDGLREHRLQAR